MLGSRQRNKWCCFCKYWFNPAYVGLKMKSGCNMYEIDTTRKCKCLKSDLTTPAISTCRYFEKTT